MQFLILLFLLLPSLAFGQTTIIRGLRGQTSSVVQENAALYCVDSGTTDTYVCGVSPALTTYTEGMVLYLVPATSNTDEATLNVDSLGAKSILTIDGAALTTGDIDQDQPNPLFYDGTNFRILREPAAATPTIEQVMTAGNATTKCTEADPCQLGNGTVYVNIYVTDANQMVIEPSTAADRYLTCMTNQKCGFYSVEHGEAIFDFDPDAASMLSVYAVGTSFKPKKTIDFPAASLTTDTAQCASPALATINSGAPRYTIICTENDASTIYGEVVMPDAWDGGTVTFKHRYVQTAADTGSMLSDIAAACRRSGDTINNTWGSEVAIDDAAVSGSNIIDMTTSAAVTPNGTCAGGALLQFRWQYDGTGNPTTAAATLHHLGFTMEYSVTSLSD